MERLGNKVLLVAGLVLIVGLAPINSVRAQDTDWQSVVQAPVAVDRTVEAGVPPAYTIPLVEALIKADVPLMTYSTFVQVVPQLMVRDRALLEKYPTLVRQATDTGIKNPYERARQIRDQLVDRGISLSLRFPTYPDPVQPGFISEDIKQQILDREQDQQDSEGRLTRGRTTPPATRRPGPGMGRPGSRF